MKEKILITGSTRGIGFAIAQKNLLKMIKIFCFTSMGVKVRESSKSKKKIN